MSKTAKIILPYSPPQTIPPPPQPPSPTLTTLSSFNNIYDETNEKWFIPYFTDLPPPRRLCFRLGLFVGLFVCEQDNSKSYGRILMKFSGYV